MRLFESARQYHNLTKYTFDDVKSVYSDYTSDSRSETEKLYSDKPVFELPKKFNKSTKNLSQSYNDSSEFGKFIEFSEQELTIDTLSQLLFMTNGITDIKEFGSKKIYFRASPSASALYPTETYLYVHRVKDLPQGFYYFQPQEHQLIQIKAGDFKAIIEQAGYSLKIFASAPVIFIFSSIMKRIRWRFKERSYRYALMDVGYIAENLTLSGSSLNLGVNLVGDFVDQSLNTLFGFEDSNELSFLLAPIGYPQKSLDIDEYEFGMYSEKHDRINIEAPDLSLEAYLKSSHFVAGKEYQSVQVKLPFIREPLKKEPHNQLFRLPEANKNIEISTQQVIEQRRSAHNFLRTSIDINELSTLLYHLRKVPVLYNFPSYFTYLIVSNVGDLKNGIYLYHPLQHSVEMLKIGTFRGDISYLTLAQDAVFNCSVSIFFSTDFDDINIFSNRGYRYAHFNVGMLSESLYLTATALNLGVRGIGNFFDDNINSFFQVNESSENILGGVIVGRY